MRFICNGLIAHKTVARTGKITNSINEYPDTIISREARLFKKCLLNICAVYGAVYSMQNATFLIERGWRCISARANEK